MQRSGGQHGAGRTDGTGVDEARVRGGGIGRRNALRLTGLVALGVGATGGAIAGGEQGGAESTDVPEGEPTDVTDSDWTMWRFNRSNTGLNPQAFGGTEFPNSWTYDEPTDRMIYSPAVADSVAYFGAFDSKMHAVDVATGEQLWTAEAGDIIQSTPSILDGTVYSAAYDGEIYAWDADTGEEIWNVVGGGAGERTTSVTVDSDGETIFVGSDDAIYSLVPETGETNWEFGTSTNLTGSPSIADGVAYQGDWNGQLYAVDTGTGTEVWSRQLGSDIRSTAAVVDDVLYIGVFGGAGSAAADELPAREGPPLDHLDPSADTPASDNEPTGVYALNAADGSELWSYQMDTVFSSPLVADGLVFAADYGGTFVALERTTGELVWSHEFDAGLGNDGPTSSPVYADGVVYAGSGAVESSLFAFDAQSGAVLGQFDTGGGAVRSPAVTESNLYVTAEDNDENAELLGYTADTEGRSVTGTVTGPVGEPVDGTELVLFPRHQEGAALSLLSEYPDYPEPSSVLDVEAGAVTDGGEYSLTGVETGDYHVLVLPTPGSGYTPILAEDVIVGESDIERDITLSQDRPLAELDDVMADLLGPASRENRGAIGEHLDSITTETAAVTDEGVQELPSSEQLASVFGVTDSALNYDLDQPRAQFQDQLKADILGEGLEVAEYGLDKALGAVWDQLDAELQEELTGVTGTLGSEEWFSELEYPDREWLVTQGYKLTPLYVGATDEIDDARDQYDGIAVQEPHGEFSVAAAKSALDEVRRQVDNPGYGVPGYVVLPDGRGFDIDQSGAYVAAFEWTSDQIDNIETAQTLAQAGKVVGGVLILTGKGAPAGAALLKVSAAGYKKAEFAATIARFKLAVEAVLANIYWGIDTRQTASLAAETVAWLGDATQGSLVEADLEIVETDLNLTEPPVSLLPEYVYANRPPPADVPDWLPIDGIGLQTKAVYDGEVTVRNNSDQTHQFEVTMYNQYDEGTAVSNEAAVHPGPGATAELGPGEETTVELEWVSDFRLGNILSLYTMIIQVWSGGIIRDDTNVAYEVLPSVEVQGDRARLRTSRLAVTGPGRRHDEALTLAEFNEHRPRTETVVDETLTPDARTESVTVTASEDANRVAFVLSATAGVALQVFDEQGRLVGYDPEVDAVRTQIPDARYVGPNATPQIVATDTEPGRTYTVEIVGYRFRGQTGERVTLRRVEIPERDSLLSVSPDKAAAVITPGETQTAEVQVAEVGDQVGLDGVSLDPGPLQNGNGETLEGVELVPGETGFDVGAGELRAATLAISADDTVDLPGAPAQTRFEGDLTVETVNAGSLDVSLSALVLDTDREDVSLAEAATSVEGVGVYDADLTQFESERPEYVTLVDAYELSVSGEGTVTLGVPDPRPGSRLFAFAVGEEWTELDTGRVDDRMQISLDASVETDHLVVGVAPPVVADSRPRDLDGDGLFEDVDGDGSFTIFDVQEFFIRFESDIVQSDPVAFNFDDSNAPEEVTIFDVQGLFDRLAS